MRTAVIAGAVVVLAGLAGISGLVLLGLAARARLEARADDARARAARRCPDHVEPSRPLATPAELRLLADLRETLDRPLDEWLRPS